MISLRVFTASSYAISGFGFDKANTIGSLAMLFRSSGVIQSAIDNPTNTSAPIKASCNELTFRSVTNCFLMSSRPLRSLFSTPLLSHMTIFAFFAPSARYSFVQLTAAAPAPLTTIVMSSIFLPTISNALSNAAAEIIAVPCWSSCMIGMFIFLRSSVSILKHSGAFMSSRFTPPNVGSSALTILMNSSGSSWSISMSNTSIPANFLNNTPFPSITGLEASGPIFPKPSTAVPLDITATRFPLAVYL